MWRVSRHAEGQGYGAAVRGSNRAGLPPRRIATTPGDDGRRSLAPPGSNPALSARRKQVWTLDRLHPELSL
jgi:hypothetical protein